jgi:hypothetical protein
MADDKKALHFLDDLSGYKVASDYSDVRGWEVKDSTQRTIGKVDRLLVNKNTERVVYLDVEVNPDLIDHKTDPYETPATEGVHQFLNKEGENHLIIPVGMVDLNEDNKYVYCDQINSETFSKTRRYRKGEDFDFDYEQNVMRSYRGDPEDEYYDEDDFYNRPEFDDRIRSRRDPLI